jgi:hypothetical protein
MNKIEFNVDEDNLLESLGFIARTIFSDYQIVTPKNNYRILELEFYYHSLPKNRDEQCYKDTKQKTHGEWFFHYSGIDITIGNESAFGSFLIRSIGKLDNQEREFKVINGPLKLKNEILNNFDLVTTELKFPFFQFVPKKFDFGTESSFKRTTRVGISRLKEDYLKEYRFLIFEEMFDKKYRPKIAIELKDPSV